jgi:NAD(P)-dependent dehydrogenase (short-subunit alcohol dehydrogenase family)
LEDLLQHWTELPVVGKLATASLIGGSLLYALRKYCAGGVNKHRPDLTGKVALITGANTGIGIETAKYLAKLNADVYFTVRDHTKGEETTARIKAENGSGHVDYFLLELTSLKSVRSFVGEYKKRTNGKKIDFLIENAGVMIPPYTKTEEGFELQFGVNHLAHFLLTDLLLKDNLINEPGRIVVVASKAHSYVKRIQFDDLNWEKGYSRVKAYGQSKMANILFAKELNRRLKEQGKNIVAVSLHPGMIMTDLNRHIPALVRYPLYELNRLFFKTAYQGAQTTLHCALAPEVVQQGGEYFSDCAVVKPGPGARDYHDARRLWEISEKLVAQSL